MPTVVPPPMLGGSPLKAQRIALDLTQAELSAISGVGVSSIALYERGFQPMRPTPTYRVLVAALAELEAEA